MAEAILLYKDVRLHTTRFMSGSPLLVPTRWMKLDKSGIPTSLGIDLKKLLRSKDLWDKRFILSLLTLTRALTIEGEPNFKSITDPISKPVSPDLISEIVNMLPSTVGRKDFPKVDHTFKEFHVTTKGGPNGLALDWSTHELSLLNQFPDLVEAIHTIGGETLKMRMEELKEVLDVCPVVPLTRRKGETLRSLKVKSDKEGKIRVFAILDYWSQTSMRELHIAISKLLKEVESDCTFDQNSRLGRIVPKEHFHSLDLKDATDRFPIVVQKAVLESLTNSAVAAAWEKIMVGLPFTFKPRGLRAAPITVEYKTGQPMGAYSSWPLFALCHHLVVQAASKRAGWKQTYTNYMLLGDDLVLGDDEVAKHYLDIIGDLSVPVSSTKTHVSKHMYEFAKRWMYRGFDVTGFPISALSTYHGPETIMTVVSLLKRTWGVDQLSYSRPELAVLLSIIWKINSLDKKKLHLEILRVWEGFHLPTGVNLKSEDNKLTIHRTIEYFFKHKEEPVLTCNRRASNERVLETLNDLLHLVKLDVLGETITSTSRNVDQYFKKLVMQVRRNPTFDMSMLQNLPHYLSKLPVLVASRQYVESLVVLKEHVIKFYAEGQFRGFDVSDVPQVLGFNPLTLINKDAGELAFKLHSTVAKKLKNFLVRVVRVGKINRDAIATECDEAPPNESGEKS
jgi:hypothetical protein